MQKSSPDPAKPPPSRLATTLFAAPFLLAGGAILAIGAGWMPHDPASVHAPRWVIVTCGFMFMSGGLAMMSAAYSRNRKPSPLFGIVILLGLTAVVNWVAFGPGERNFTSKTSVGGLVDRRPVSDGSGRAVFGAAAVLMDGLLVWGAVSWLRKRRRADLTPDALRRD